METHPVVEDGNGQAETHEGSRDGESENVPGRSVAGPEEGAVDGSQVADTIDDYLISTNSTNNVSGHVSMWQEKSENSLAMQTARFSLPSNMVIIHERNKGTDDQTAAPPKQRKVYLTCAMGTAATRTNERIPQVQATMMCRALRRVRSAFQPMKRAMIRATT